MSRLEPTYTSTLPPSLPPSLPPTHPSIQYLRETLSNFIHTLVDTYAEEDYEVDPMKMQVGANLQANQQRLVMLVERAWCDILSSFNKFPT